MKSSFRTILTPYLDQDSSEYLYYSAGSVMILKNGEFTYSLMGKKKNFVNLTGCCSISKIGDAISLFKTQTKIETISNFKINTITFTLKIGLEEKLFFLLDSKPPELFSVKRFPKFTAICFKHKKTSISANYFHKSCSMVGMGAQNICEIYQFVIDLKSTGFK